MKLTYKVCCGVDVHKTFFVATIITSSVIVQSRQDKAV